MKKFKVLSILMAVVLMATVAFAASPSTLKKNTWNAEQVFKQGITAENFITLNGASVLTNTSRVFYVRSTTGANTLGNDQGLSFSKPWATIDYAINQCTASEGDVIVVLPYHAETIAAADGFDADVAGISIIGIGIGEAMPTLTFSAIGSTVAIGADDVTVKNIRFLAGITDVVKAIAVEAGGDNFLLLNCEFPAPATATVEFLDAIDLIAAADGVKIIGNTYWGAGTSLANHFIDAGNGVNTRLEVRDNFIWDNFAVSAIWSNDIDLLARIEGNTINNLTAGQHCVEYSTTATGVIKDNLFISTTYADTLDPGSMYVSGNKLASAVDSSPVDIPPDPNKALRSVVKSDGSCAAAGDDDLFIITGGPVRAKIVGVVTDTIGTTATNGDLQIDVTAPANTFDLNAAPVAIEQDAIGTVYTNVDSTSVFTATTLGASIIDDVAAAEAEFILPVGTVIFRSSGASAGTIQWTMTYEALSPNSMVVPAP